MLDNSQMEEARFLAFEHVNRGVLFRSSSMERNGADDFVERSSARCLHYFRIFVAALVR